MVYFENTTVQFCTNLNFHKKALEFVLGFIPSFYIKTSGMKNNVDETPSTPRWYFSTIFPFKTLITQHQDQFPLRFMAKRYGIQ